ncbi:MAG: hypothetical protein KBC21_04310 [Candidatus Pacebacteria bacterium]|nr:hypothetical protein [Candidatus Paceibacterota bacterium]
MRLRYRLIKTRQRLTFDILEQDMVFSGVTDDTYLMFKASNGVEIISRSRMDIQTDRLWLVGCKPNERSGSMVFSSDEKRDREFDRFQEGILEWATSHYFNNEEVVTLKELGNETFEV